MRGRRLRRRQRGENERDDGTCHQDRDELLHGSSLGGLRELLRSFGEIGSDGSGSRCLDLLEHELLAVSVHANRVAVAEVACKQAQRERVLDEPLDRALQRTGAVRRIPAGLGELLLRGIGQLEGDVPLGKPLTQAFELQLDDLGNLSARAAKLDDLVIGQNSGRNRPRSSSALRVRGHDQHGVPEVDGERPWPSVSRRRQYLQQHTSRPARRFLDLVEQTTVYGRRRTASVS